MELEFNLNTWIVIGIIILALVIKIIVHIYRKKTGREWTNSNRSATTTSVVRSPQTRTSPTSATVIETGPIVYFANDNRKGIDKEYRFNYKWVHDTGFNKSCWRAYILRTPNFNLRSKDLHTTHRLTDCNNNYWVCWDTPVTSLDDMKAVSKIWADNIQEYIATGKKFG